MGITGPAGALRDWNYPNFTLQMYSEIRYEIPKTYMTFSFLMFIPYYNKTCEQRPPLPKKRLTTKWRPCIKYSFLSLSSIPLREDNLTTKTNYEIIFIASRVFSVRRLHCIDVDQNMGLTQIAIPAMTEKHGSQSALLTCVTHNLWKFSRHYTKFVRFSWSINQSNMHKKQAGRHVPLLT